MAIRSVKTGAFSRSMLVGNSYYIPPAFESISTVVVGAGGQSTISFTSIPATYQHLQIRATVFNLQTSGDVYYSVTPAGTTPTTLNHYLRGNESSVSSGTKATYRWIADNGNAHTTAPMVFIMDILDYANTNKNKTIKILRGIDGAGFAIQKDVGYNSSILLTTSAITDINFDILSTGFGQHSSFALYGIKGA